MTHTTDATPPFTIALEADILRCRIQGEFTLETTSRFREAVEPFLEAKRCAMAVIDLEHVRFMDSSGIGSLVALNSRLQALGIQLHLLKPSIQVRRTLELVQLTRFFSMVDDAGQVDQAPTPAASR
ncbi:MAG: STAS domain-containing protein [Desulfovibrio sp.]|nr:STAS domain-containing protein [Desulfovibrio sp.]MCA1986279.1 STAS domain-containing protein [Desulfovibrio sp.]